MKKKPSNSIVQLPTPSLRQLSADIAKDEYPEMKKLIKIMYRSMDENNGIGLAAPQIGLNINIFVISREIAKQFGIPSAYINPTVTSASSKEEVIEEGCLSVPGQFGLVKRAYTVTVTAYDEKGKQFTIVANDIAARIIQHESDHLKGTLIVDKFMKTQKKNI
jgi:peptide deformylase